MVTSRRLLIILPLLLLALLVSACDSTPTDLSGEETEFVVSLPRVVVAIDDDGVPSVAGLSADTLKNLTFGAVDLSWLRMDPNLVNNLKAMGLQNMEVVYRDDGLYIFINGQQLPFISWDEESLDNTADLVTAVGGLDPSFAQALKTILPFAQRLGANLAVSFPAAAGAEVMPLRDLSQEIQSVSVPASDEVSPVQLRVEVGYDENGEPMVPGGPILALLGISTDMLRLPPATVAGMTNSGIGELTISAQEDGIQLLVNGQPLPKLAWTEQGLDNIVQIVAQLYLGDQAGGMTQLLTTLLPVLSQVDIELVLDFPES